MLPRWALARSLDATGVPPPLRDAILDVHEACCFEIRHNKYTGRLPMKKRVRQGCVLSPILFAIFTGHLYECFRDRTSPEWAARFVTLFAADTMLHWSIATEADLAFLCRSVRVTFALFREFGMQVNPTKSKLILNVKGGYAKRWLRSKREQTMGL